MEGLRTVFLTRVLGDSVADGLLNDDPMVTGILWSTHLVLGK